MFARLSNSNSDRTKLRRSTLSPTKTFARSFFFWGWFTAVVRRWSLNVQKPCQKTAEKVDQACDKSNVYRHSVSSLDSSLSVSYSLKNILSQLQAALNGSNMINNSRTPFQHWPALQKASPVRIRTSTLPSTALPTRQEWGTGT